MKSPVYGYMRLHTAESDSEIAEEERRLARWAMGEGYCLMRVYQEAEDGAISALVELIEELRRTGTRAVVVPSVRHLGRNRPLQDHLWAHLVDRARAEVYEVSTR
ncbi:recombinase family protein [Streptomyces sp. NPDC047002]|uniref:recombinase family protein n=1 Tax=Streptomyces sp. NPDC047002 TaxID=3155475 RepID=UPI00345574AF